MESITVDGIKVPITNIERSSLSEWTGNVPKRFSVDRVYRFDGWIHGERFLGDGSVIEISNLDGEWRAYHVTNPSAVDPAEEVLWERAGRAERELSELLENGLSPAEALDFWAVEIHGHTQAAWADTRGLSGHQAVGENTRKARKKLTH